LQIQQVVNTTTQACQTVAPIVGTHDVSAVHFPGLTAELSPQWGNTHATLAEQKPQHFCDTLLFVVPNLALPNLRIVRHSTSCVLQFSDTVRQVYGDNPGPAA